MKVSIVTLSFNQASFLPRAIASVLAQDYREIEYIVVDPGSEDGSRDIIDSYRSRLAHAVYQADNGPADGLNHGFKVATGDLLAYVNADDVLLPGAVREAVACFQADPSGDVVYGDGYVIDAEGRVLAEVESSPFDLRRFAYGSVMVLQQATFIRMAAYRESPGFNPANRTCWDGELLAELAAAGRQLKHVRKKWGAFSLYPESITGSQRHAEVAKGDLRRIFSIAMGRDWRLADGALRYVARLGKWCRSPVATVRRARGALTGPPRLHVTVTADNRIAVVPLPLARADA